MSTTDSILNAFCWMLIHSIWQGILAAALAGLVIVSTPKTGVRWRYGLLVSVFALFLIASGVTFFQQLEWTNAASHRAMTPRFDNQQSLLSEQTVLPTFQGQEITLFQSVVQFLNTNAFWIVLIWAFFFLFKSVRLVTGLRHLHQLRHRNVHQPDESWPVELARLRNLLGIRQLVRLLESERVTVPVTIGFFKPLILVPLGLLTSLSPEQAETVLLHELAHIRRKDYLVNLMQCLVETVFFFNPALLWISALIRDEREACCDDLVVNAAGNRKSYLEVLVLFQETQLESQPFVMALTNRRMHLLNRVKRMLSNENQQLTSLEKTILVVALLGMTAFSFVPEPNSAPQTRKTATIKSQIDPKPVPQKANPTTAATAKTGPKAFKKPLSSKTKPVPDVLIDTIRFGKSGFSSVRFDSTNDPKPRYVTITAVDETGKKYTLSKVDGNVTGLSINGQPVATNELSKYTDLFQRIDRFFEERLEQKQKRIARDMALGRAQYEQSQAEMKRATAAKLAYREKEGVAGKEKQPFMEKSKLGITDKNTAQFAKKDSAPRSEKDATSFSKKNSSQFPEKSSSQFPAKEKFRFPAKETTGQNNVVSLKKRREFDHDRIQPDVDRVHGIMADLVQEGVVGSTDGIDWLGLSDTELIVNGKKQPAELHEKLQKKYGVSANYGLYYGPVQMSGTGFFLDRKDTSTPSKE